MPLFCFEDHLTVSSLCSLPSGVIVSQRAIDDPSKLGGAATFSPGPYQVLGRENAPEPYQMKEPGQYRGVGTAAVVHPPAVGQHVQQPGVLERFDGSGRGIGFCPRSPAIRRFQPENHSLVCKSMRRWLNGFASLRINERIVYGISHHANGPVSQIRQEYRL